MIGYHMCFLIILSDEKQCGYFVVFYVLETSHNFVFYFGVVRYRGVFLMNFVFKHDFHLLLIRLSFLISSVSD
jgi:hypothetical protein